jgi:hypothetical protein
MVSASYSDSGSGSGNEKSNYSVRVESFSGKNDHPIKEQNTTTDNYELVCIPNKKTLSKQTRANEQEARGLDESRNESKCPSRHP